MHESNRDAGREDTLIKQLPVPFTFYRRILKGDHLHFGLWQEGSSGSMEAAQEAMFELLLSFFPASPATILDVGCGLGYSAALLAQRGYRVVAIAPSQELVAYAKAAYRETGVDFHVAGYFDEGTDLLAAGTFDVLFFQESAQYLGPLDKVFERARSLLKEKGHVIIGDEVLYSDSLMNETAVHRSTSFVLGLAENGFKLAEHRKVGREAAPTYDFIIEQFSSRFDELAASGGPDSAAQLSHFLSGWEKQRQWHRQGLLGYEIFVAVKDRYTVRAYRAGDEETIVPLFNTVFHTTRTLDHWYWKFRDNPYGACKTSEVFSPDGDLVAHYAGYPVPFWSSAEGEDLLSLQIGDTMTVPGVRNIGLGKTGILARVAAHFYAKFCTGMPFIYGFNTGHIRKLGSRYLGYEYLGEVPFWVRDVASRPFAPPSFLRRLSSAYSVERVNTIGPEWTDFFSRTAPAYGLLVKRDAQYLVWRYLTCPDGVHRMFSVRRRGRLCGWGVFAQRGDVLVWGDAIFSDDPDAVAMLLHTVLKDHYRGVKTLQGWFSPNPGWWTAILERLGLERVPEPNSLSPGFIIFGGGMSMQRLRESLYYTMGDSDLF